MNISMIQEFGKWTHTYNLTLDNKTLHGTANRRLAIEKRRITLADENSKVVIKIIEKSNISPIIERIPIVNWFNSLRFQIEEEGEIKGEIKVPKNIIQEKFFINVNNYSFSCYYHRNGFKGDTYSIFKDNNQIGRITREKSVKWNAHTYSGEFDYDTDYKYNAIFMILVDVLWHTEDININETMYQNGYEFHWGLDRKFGKKQNLNWQPKLKLD